jgi:hypothetical protein
VGVLAELAAAGGGVVNVNEFLLNEAMKQLQTAMMGAQEGRCLRAVRESRYIEPLERARERES